MRSISLQFPKPTTCNLEYKLCETSEHWMLPSTCISKTSSPFKAEQQQQQENKNMKMKDEAEQEQEGGFCPLT